MGNNGKYILIVDDNLKNLEITAKILKEENYLISLAQDGKKALTLLEQLIPDLILLDVMMPEMDGLALCRLIKQNEKLCDTPIIFLTARNNSEDLAEGFKAGGVDYITKPFNREELLIRVKNHLELAGSRKSILEMNKTRDKLYSIIAHDIRTPFSGIAVTINSIASGYLDPGSKDYIEIFNHLEKTATETITLLDNLLTFTKFQGQSISISPTQINLNIIILECIELLKGNADRKNININVNIPDDLKACIDEITIHAVFRNLIFNAIKFTPENGMIDITGKSNCDFAQISVKDTGIGIPEEVIKKIFIDNEHYTSRGTNNEQGSGLGSYIVKDFIAKNRGKIEITSTPGSGTEIMVFLPLTNSSKEY